MMIPSERVSKLLLICNALAALVYLSWWFMPGHVGNPLLYGLLLFGEVYHVLMTLLFLATIWPRKAPSLLPAAGETIANPVAVFITVAGEPAAIVRETVLAAKQLRYPNKTIYILNDGFVAQKENWQDIVALAKELQVFCITRTEAGGAKAGNINNALHQTTEPYIAIFDADMVPHASFLAKTMPYFTNKQLGFVQTPQYYKNNALNVITQGAWEQQSFFFGAIMQGKATVNAAFICGTNVVIAREALLAVGGMDEASIAEDFLTSIKIHQKGYQSVYLPEVLSEGLAPEDLLSYFKQQLRWARGSLEVLVSQNPIFKPGLSFGQRREYLSSALFYCNGVVVLIDITMPLLFLFTGIIPVATTTISFALYFVPFMFLNLFTIYLASGNTMTFRAMSFSQASFTLQLMALKGVLFRQRSTFAVTAKQALSGNFFYLAYPHILYVILAVVAAVFRIAVSGISPSVITNIAWASFNVALFMPFVLAALPIQQTQRVIPYAKIEPAEQQSV